MTVKEMITELLNYKMDDEVVISLDGKEKISKDITIKKWTGLAEIHFVDWRKY